MGTLKVAIETENWELAALCLLLGIAKAAEKLPPAAVDALIELIAEPVPARAQRLHGRRDDARRRHS